MNLYSYYEYVDVAKKSVVCAKKGMSTALEVCLVKEVWLCKRIYV